MRLCRLMCGRPLAFRPILEEFRAMPFFRGRSPKFETSPTEAQSASAHQTAKPQLKSDFAICGDDERQRSSETVRAGCASSARSKSNNSTLVAFLEETLKLTPSVRLRAESSFLPLHQRPAIRSSVYRCHRICGASSGIVASGLCAITRAV